MMRAFAGSQAGDGWIPPAKVAMPSSPSHCRSTSLPDDANLLDVDHTGAERDGHGATVHRACDVPDVRVSDVSALQGYG
jgi:hypothetical protein